MILFQYLPGFNVAWDSNTGSETADGLQLEEGQLAVKLVNLQDRLWVRASTTAAISVSWIPKAGQPVVVAVEGDELLIGGQSTPLPPFGQIELGWQDGALLVFVDGNEWHSTSFEVDLSWRHVEVAVRGPGLLAELTISSSRLGLSEPSPIAEHFGTAHDVEIDGTPYNLVPQAGAFQKRALSAFNPRIGVGAPKYTDLSGFQHLAITSMHAGFGFPQMVDEFAYSHGYCMDTTDVGMVRLANSFDVRQLGFAPPSWELLDRNGLVAAVVDSAVFIGLKYTSSWQQSCQCMLIVSPDGVHVVSFDNASGVNDILDNGRYIIATLSGGRVMRASRQPSSGIVFSDGGGSIVFTGGYLQFGSVYVWEEAGNSLNPPVDMGLMAIHDEFLWVAEAQKPWLHRAAQVDLSDLEGGNPDDNSTYDIAAIRVGGGDVPITALVPYLGKLYVGREDGLFAVDVGGAGIEDIVVSRIDTAPRSPDNYRGMTTYAGFLVYQRGGDIYLFNGTAEQRITPGPVNSKFPYKRYERYGAFAACGAYLFVLASPDPATEPRPRWDLLVYNRTGWHCLARLDDGDAAIAASSPALVIVNDPLRAACVWPSSAHSALAIGTIDTRLGARHGGAVARSGTVVTSAIDFGLVTIPRYLRLVRVEAENIVAGTSRITIEYSLDLGEWQPLGTIADPNCNTIFFPSETVCRRLSLRISLQTDDPIVCPILRAVIIQYMDRPETVWGYQMILDISESPRAYSGSPSQYGVAELKRKLENLRDSMVPVLLREPSGEEAEVFITDVAFTAVAKAGSAVRYVANVTAMGTTPATLTRGIVGVASA